MIPLSITFETPSDLKTKYQAALVTTIDNVIRSTVFDTSGNLKLRLQPDQYKALRSEDGKLEEGFGYTWYDLKAVRQGFEIDIKDQRAEIRFILWEIARRQRGRWGQVATIWVDDELGFDPIKDYATGKTRKRGVIWMDDVSGAIAAGKISCPAPDATDGQPVITLSTPRRYYTLPYKVRFWQHQQDMVF